MTQTDGELNVIQFMRTGGKPKHTTPAAPPKPPAPPGHITAYAQSAVDDECAALESMAPNSGRNHALNRAAFNLYSIVLAGEVEEQYVRDRLIDACHRNGVLAEDGQPKCEQSIDSGFKGAATKVGARHIKPLEEITPAVTVDFGAPPGASGDSGDGDSDGEEIDARFIDGASFILDIPEEIPTLWGDGNRILWMQGESLMIAGPMGLGKTTLGGQLMRAQLGIGPPTVLGMPVTPVEGKILYLAMDRPAQARRAMARQFKECDRAALADKLVVWQGPPPGDIAKYPSVLRLLAEKAGADVVYLDSVKDAAVGLSDDAVGAGYSRARQELMAAGCQLCELHHTTKRGANGGPPKDVADIYGSTWITNGTGSIILLSGNPGDPIVGFLHARQPMDEVGPFRLNHDQANGELTVLHEADPVDMLNNCGPDGLSARTLAIALWHSDEDDPHPSRGDVEKARRRLEQLVEMGIAVEVKPDRDGRGAASVWFPAAGTTFTPGGDGA